MTYLKVFDRGLGIDTYRTDLSKRREVNISRFKGEIGDTPHSPGWLGNPVKIGLECPECGEVHKNGGATLPCYEKFLRRKLEWTHWRRAFMEELGEDPDTICAGCGRNAENCHGVVIKKLSTELHSFIVIDEEGDYTRLSLTNNAVPFTVQGYTFRTLLEGLYFAKLEERNQEKLERMRKIPIKELWKILPEFGRKRTINDLEVLEYLMKKKIEADDLFHDLLVLDSYDREIFSAVPFSDPFLCVGQDWKGKNMYGRLLMRIREERRS